MTCWTSEGRYAVASGYTGLPLPVQRPHPPIMIGGSRKVVLSYAGREADIVSLNNVDFVPRNDDGLTPQEEATRRLDYVRTAAGDRFAVARHRVVALLHPDHGRRRTQPPRRSPGTSAVTPDGLDRHPNVLIGTVDAIVEDLQERRSAYGVNYVTVQQGELERFAPVVARLAGT